MVVSIIKIIIIATTKIIMNKEEGVLINFINFVGNSERIVQYLNFQN